MVSLVSNSLSLWRGTNYTADVRWQPPAREIRHPAQADSDEPDACRADAQAVGRYSGIGVEYEAEQAQTKDGAGGGPAAGRGADMRAETWHETSQDQEIPDSDVSMGWQGCQSFSNSTLSGI